MEIPLEFYEEDQLAKQKVVDDSERAMKKTIRDNDFYGKLEKTSSLMGKKSPDSE
jgi:hypothetical protein